MLLYGFVLREELLVLNLAFYLGDIFLTFIILILDAFILGVEVFFFSYF